MASISSAVKLMHTATIWSGSMASSRERLAIATAGAPRLPKRSRVNSFCQLSLGGADRFHPKGQ